MFLILTSIKSLENKEKIKRLIIIGIPVAILAIFQMIYNYIRFDNIFEFGARYQLTAFNMTSYMAISFSRALIGIVLYTFKAPTIQPFTFPYIYMGIEGTSTGMNEFYYENRTIGLAFIALLWVFLYKKQICKESKELKWIVNISLVSALALMAINAGVAGVVEQYTIDFKCILALIAIILLLRLVSIKNNSTEINKLFLILCIVTLITMIPLNLTSEDDWLLSTSKPLTIFLKNSFEFWT